MNEEMIPNGERETETDETRPHRPGLEGIAETATSDRETIIIPKTVNELAATAAGAMGIADPSIVTDATGGEGAATATGNTTSSGSAADALTARLTADALEFIEAFPDVEIESIPPEVFHSALTGRGLVTAYAIYENNRLRSELQSARQAAENSRRTPGSAGTAGTDTDAFDAIWYDGR